MDSSAWINKSRYFAFARRSFLDANSPSRVKRRKAQIHSDRVAELARRAAAIPLTGGEGDEGGPSLFRGETYRYGETV